MFFDHLNLFRASCFGPRARFRAFCLGHLKLFRISDFVLRFVVEPIPFGGDHAGSDVETGEHFDPVAVHLAQPSAVNLLLIRFIRRQHSGRTRDFRAAPQIEEAENDQANGRCFETHVVQFGILAKLGAPEKYRTA